MDSVKQHLLRYATQVIVVSLQDVDRYASLRNSHLDCFNCFAIPVSLFQKDEQNAIVPNRMPTINLSL